MKHNGMLAGMLLALALVATQASAEEQIFRINNMVEPESLDPGVVTGVPEHRILSNLFEGLTTSDPKDLSPRPGMAASWTVSKDGLTYTFKLRDARWTDGKPVTAHDFVYAWERVLNPKMGAKYAQQLFYLKNGEEYNKGRITDFSQVGVKALDERTLQVTLRCPTAYFLDLTSFYTLYPVPRWVIEAHGKDWVKPGKIVTNGPFRLVSWVPQRELVLEKNPHAPVHLCQYGHAEPPGEGLVAQHPRPASAEVHQPGAVTRPCSATSSAGWWGSCPSCSSSSPCPSS